MKKVYLFYVNIPAEIFNNKIKYLINSLYEYTYENGIISGLYAWTDDKKIYNEFKDSRNMDIYKVEKVEFYDKSEFKLFKVDNIDLMLDYRKYRYNYKVENNQSKSKYVTVVTTKNEYIQVTENTSENLYEFGPKVIPWIDYTIFKEDIIMALDTVNYTTEYDLDHGSESRSDAAAYNKSFSLTSFGNQIKVNDDNELNILLYLFRYLFYGDEKPEVD